MNGIEDPHARANSLATTRVLVIDDSRDNADMLALVLKRDGAQTACAYRGVEALEVFRSWRPHVALVDLGLPDVTGYELARAMRAEAHGAGMLLLAVTGFADDGSLERVRAAGFDGRLTKPVDLARLKERIEQHVGVRGS